MIIRRFRRVHRLKLCADPCIRRLTYRFRRIGCLVQFSRCRVILAAVLLVACCRKPDYFPLQDNQVRRYAGALEVMPTEAGEQESLAYTITVTGSAVEPGLGRVWEVLITRNEEPFLSFFVRRTKDAVFILPASHLDGLEPTSGWVKLLELPLRAGAFWYGDAEHSVSFEVMARGDLVTPAGRFRNCFRLQVHAPEPYVITFWLAPDAGIVRWNRRFAAYRREVTELIYR